MIHRFFRRIRPGVSRLFTRRMLRRGIDRTDRASSGRALVLAPHPDDEAIGCGALIARKVAAGTDVHIVIATDGRHSERAAQIGPEELARVRHEEALTAARALGVDATRVHFLDFEDGTLGEQREALAAAIREATAGIVVDEVYAPHGDQHLDHQALSEVARRLFGSSREVRLYEYPVRYWYRTPWVIPAPNLLVGGVRLFLDPIREWTRRPAMLIHSGEYQPRKVAALNAYAGEMDAVGHFAYTYAEFEVEVFFPIN